MSKGESFIDRATARPQMRVGALIGVQIDAHKAGDFQIVRAAERGIHRRQERSERVAHRVRRHPGAALRFHVAHERHFKFVTIEALPASHFGLEHEGRTEAVGISQPRAKFLGERDRALFQIFKANGGRLAQLHVSAPQVEPPRHGLDDFPFTHPAVESAVENKFQIIARRLVDQVADELGLAKVLARIGLGAFDAHFEARICAGESMLDAPIKKTAHRHVRAVCRLRAIIAEPVSVETPNILGRHRFGRAMVAQKIGEISQAIDFCAGRARRPTVAGSARTNQRHVGDETLGDLGKCVAVLNHVRRGANFGGFADRLRFVLGAQIKPLASAIAGDVEPVGVAPKHDPFEQFFECGFFHRFTFWFTDLVHTLGHYVGLCKPYTRGRARSACESRTRVAALRELSPAFVRSRVSVHMFTRSALDESATKRSGTLEDRVGIVRGARPLSDDARKRHNGAVSRYRVKQKERFRCIYGKKHDRPFVP